MDGPRPRFQSYEVPRIHATTALPQKRKSDDLNCDPDTRSPTDVTNLPETPVQDQERDQEREGEREQGQEEQEQERGQKEPEQQKLHVQINEHQHVFFDESQLHTKEMENGRVICEMCGKAISFRDEGSGGFTLKHWDAHRIRCLAASQPPPDPVIYTPESTAQALANPPAKRRRAKRSEDERIDYLRADPYVAKFEAYRVLCASCDKWIRLRPNSTYCSIPWDAHRKSCLAKRAVGSGSGVGASGSGGVGAGGTGTGTGTGAGGGAGGGGGRNSYAPEERDGFFAGDPDVRKFDAERVLCRICDTWVAVGNEDHLRAVQTWVRHRDECNGKAVAAVAAAAAVGVPSLGVPPSSHLPTQIPIAFLPSTHHKPPSLPPPTSPLSSATTTSTATATATASTNTNTTTSPRPLPLTSPPPPSPSTSQLNPLSPSQSLSLSLSQPTSNPNSQFKDYSPYNFPPAHESRRRNAEQRAAALRADPLVVEVEPSRVFCALCQKWVQLRQDSSFCAYPWMQHRGKCLVRHQKRVQKAVAMAEKLAVSASGMSGKGAGVEGDGDGDGNESLEEPESEEGVETGGEEGEEGEKRAMKRRLVKKKVMRRPRGRPRRVAGVGVNGVGSERRMEDVRRVGGDGMDVDGDGDGDVDADGDAEEEESEMSEGEGDAMQDQLRANVPPHLADLDSPAGRMKFVLHSLNYLFKTTYESSDEMTLVALLAYLNAAMPADKHEDFDAVEVRGAVNALQEEGKVVFRDDILRLPG